MAEKDTRLIKEYLTHRAIYRKELLSENKSRFLIIINYQENTRVSKLLRPIAIVFKDLFVGMKLCQTDYFRQKFIA